MSISRSPRSRKMLRLCQNDSKLEDIDLENKKGVQNLISKPQSDSGKVKYKNKVHSETATMKKPKLTKSDTEENMHIGEDDVIFWTRAGNRTFWPARICTDEERMQLEAMQDDSVSSKKENRVAVFYFGSHDVGYVSKPNMLPFEENYSKFSKKNNSRPFLMGIEEGKGELLRHQNDINPNENCLVCGKFGEVKLEHEILICDRCYCEVHMSCLDPPLKSVPEGEWFCPRCAKEAPLTYAALKKEEEEEKKRKEAARRKANQRKKIEEAEKKKLKQGKLYFENKRKADGESNVGQSKKKKSSVPSSNPSLTKTSRNIPSEQSSVVEKSTCQDTVYDVHCFVCGMGGNGHDQGMIGCDFNGCTRVYHVNCIGSAYPYLDVDEEIDKKDRSKKSFKNEKQWFCPWHFCAVCQKAETENTSKLKIKPWPQKSHLKGGTTVLKTVKDIGQTSKRKNQNGSESKPFLRCISCPTTLCEKHSSASCRLINSHGENLVPVSIQRIDKKGFFECVQCSGSVSDRRGRSHFTVPNEFKFSRIMLKEPKSLDIPEGGKECSKNIIESSSLPLSLSKIRDKICQLEYRNVAEFEDHVEYVCKSITSLIGRNHQVINEAAETVPFLVFEAIRPYKKSLDELERKLKLSKLQSFEGDRPLIPEVLYPSVDSLQTHVMKDSLNKPETTVSPEEWAKQIINGPDLDNHICERASAIESERRGNIATLFEAIEAVDDAPRIDLCEDMALFSSIDSSTINSLLESHSRALRTALTDVSRIKKAIATSQQTQSRALKGTLDLGGMPMAAEYRLVNRNLKSRLSKVTEVLNIERQGRKALQEEVEELKKKLNLK